MAEGIYSVTCSEWKLVQRRLDNLENIVSDLKSKLAECKCNPSTDLETEHSDDEEIETVNRLNAQSNLTSAASRIIGISGQSTTQSEETLALAVTVADTSNVADSTLTGSTSSSLNDGSSAGIPVTTNSTLRLTNGMGILEIEKYRRAQVKLTRCDEEEVTRTLPISRNVNDNFTSKSANDVSNSLHKKHPYLGRKRNGAQIERVSAPPLSHEKRFVCHFCSKRFGQKYNLTEHIRIHTGEKPFHCNICSTKFNQRSTLKMHTRVHTGDKPFQCIICSKTFTHVGNLKSHTRLHTGDKPLECEFCSKKFSHKSGLDFHLRCHTGERPFVCHFCSKKYIQSQHLVAHMRSHTGERPYTCQFCSKEFAERGNLTTHLRVHTREKPFSCPFCPKVFACRKSLKLHLTRHPGETPQSQSQIQYEDVPGSKP